MTKIKKRMTIGIVIVFLAIFTFILYIFYPFITLATSVKKIQNGLYTIEYKKDYGFDDFLKQGGASSDLELADFVIKRLFGGLINFNLKNATFGCSTLSVEGENGGRLFGRNFDWENCNAMIVETKPKEGYSSISTVNMDFLDIGLKLPEEAIVRLMSIATAYAPMDGMNEKGLCVAVLVIDDSPAFNQDTGKPDLTTTTAIRLLLDKAATVDEALKLLSSYDMHASANMMVHFAITDTTGRSVVVEYIEDKMIVTETPVVTNFYLASGDKFGIGSKESHTRYALLTEYLEKDAVMTMEQLRDAMSRVSKKNFNSDFVSTEWSVVYNQENGEVRYYHRENYETVYTYFVY